ncbi:MAG: TatD family hydrolase [Patescibacteria group bacterium]|nr:TatD family hydrolase [Patescibacteria group bacterium]
MKFFDAHCHLQFPQYKNDLPQVLARMRALALGGLVVGTDYEVSKAGLALARQHDFLWASVGLHPNDNEAEDFDMEKYQELALDPKVVAIGECGLDYFRTGKTPEERRTQMLRFEAHIQLALRAQKPLIIHCRDAHEDMLTTLAAHRRDHGDKLHIVMHFFTGTKELAQKYLDLGCYLSFPGPVTYTGEYDGAIDACPMDKLLVETDAPFAAPTPNRGKRNEPSFVLDVARKVAALKGLTLGEVGAQIVLNSQHIFNLTV